MSALDGKPSLAREMAFRDSIDLAAEMTQNAGEVAERLKAAV
jgi:hypothetical protein